VSDDDLFAAFVGEMRLHGKRPVPLRFDSDVVSMVGLLGILQYALRSPANNSSGPWNHCAKLARAIESKLASIGPATTAVCARGWSREFDR